MFVCWLVCYNFLKRQGSENSNIRRQQRHIIMYWTRKEKVFFVRLLQAEWRRSITSTTISRASATALTTTTPFPEFAHLTDITSHDELHRWKGGHFLIKNKTSTPRRSDWRSAELTVILDKVFSRGANYIVHVDNYYYYSKGRRQKKW